MYIRLFFFGVSLLTLISCGSNSGQPAGPILPECTGKPGELVVVIPESQWKSELGDTLIEAYWKSVQQPGEGIFIGEPLARPW